MSSIGYYPGKNVNNNVYAFLEHHVQQRPDLIPLRWVKRDDISHWLESAGGDPYVHLAHQSIGIAQFDDVIGRIAAGFQELSIEHGDRVILFLPMSLHLYAAMFALMKIGAIPVFLDSWARRSHLSVSAETVDPKAMISFEQAFQLCKDVPSLAALDIKINAGPAAEKYTATLDELMQTPRTAAASEVHQEETALITFTTGSTGAPKGANRTHRFLAAQHRALDQTIPYESADIDLPVFPIFSLNNIAAGVSTVIPAIDVGVRSDHDSLLLLAQIVSTGVTCTTLSPSHLNDLSAYCIEHGISLDGLRRVITGGAPTSRDNVSDFVSVAKKAEVWVLYGSTEVEPMAHIEAKEMMALQEKGHADPEWVAEGVNVGHLSADLNYKFLKIQTDSIEINCDSDWQKIEVPHGEVGELVVAGEHVCRDYYNNDEAFRRSKILDHNGVVWHRTGDLARIDQDGFLWIVGRIHNVVKRGGKYCFPVRAEIILKKLNFVKRCAYLGVPDAALGERAVCVVTPRSRDHDVGKENHWRGEIERIMQKNSVAVDQIVIREEIPMDSRHQSKVEYGILREQLTVEGAV